MSKRILVAIWETEHRQRHSARGPGERLALLAQALATAHRTAAAQGIPSSQRLRVILVVPEYYFAQRDAGVWTGTDFGPRSFSEEERDDIVSGLEQLSRKHPSILFVPGTVAWKQSLATATGTPTGRRHGRTRKAGAIHDLERYQELLAQSGQEEFQPAKLSPRLRKIVAAEARKGVEVDAPHIAGPVLKRLVKRGELPATSMYVSPEPSAKLEGLQKSAYHHMMRNTAYILFNGRVQFKYHKNSDYHEAIGDANTVFVPGGKVGTCEIAGIRFGIEICFDHTMAMLATGVVQHPAARGGKAMVPPMIHIVTSDSTDSVEANYQVRDQGYFVHASTGNSSVVQRQGNSYETVDPVALRLKPRYSGDILEQFAPDPRIGRYPLGCWVITV